jgi:hypothetical protein
MNEPHGALPQATLQLTPAFCGSLVTTAVKGAVELTFMLARGATIVTEIAAPWVMLTVADTDFVPSATEVAVIVTVLPLGIAGGAVNCVVPLLPVDVGLKAPHEALPQVTFQLTPRLAGSLLTVAAITAVVLVFMEAGGFKPGVKDTDIARDEGCEPSAPHPESTATMPITAIHRADRANVIERLPSQSKWGSGSGARMAGSCELEILARCVP